MVLFLRNVALLFFLLSTLFAQNGPQIVVIGAGLSGLTAAYRLQEKGFDVQVYEARNRVGGRVFTVNIEGHIAELGAQNIKDGGEAANILKLIEDLELEVESKKTPYQFSYFDQGKMFDISAEIKKREFASDELREELEKIREKTQNMQEAIDALFDSQDLLYKACSAFLSAYEGASLEKLSSIYLETLYHFLLGGLSSAHQNLGEEASIDHLWIKGGNGQLAETMAQTLLGRVHLRHELHSINKNSSGGYLLAFKNGKTVSCDILILTLPCPVYENLSIDQEVIPEERLKKICAVQYGSNAKILVPLALLPCGDLGAHSNGRVVTFLNGNSHVLNMYYIRDYGLFDASSVEKTFHHDLGLVKEVYSIEKQLTPRLARDESFATYLGPVAHSWPNDPFAKGSYSCLGPNQEESFTAMEVIEGESVKKLFAPIGHTLFFAGEHTSILLDVIGTMEAAVESGERTARLVEKFVSHEVILTK